MKTNDVTKYVMNDVIRLERGRTKRWIIKFIFTVSVLTISLVVLVSLAVKTISERQGWDLISLIQQDPEIIAAYWRDTLWIFWEVSPQHIIFAVLVISSIIISVFILTQHRRNILRKKLHQLDKYRSN